MSSLFVAWKQSTPENGGWRPVGQLQHSEGLFRFWYTKGAQQKGFRPFDQMEKLDRIYESEELFPLFANRLLPKSRPEYESYLRWSGFDADHSPDPISVLSVTEGLRQTDSIEVFPCPLPTADGLYLNRFFLHGIQWLSDWAVQRINRLEPDERLMLMPDSQNEHDSRAVAVRTNSERTMIGYVPRYFAYDVRQLLEHCAVESVQLRVARVNLDAPLQNRVLCEIRSCWPSGFQPCDDEQFAPISPEVPANCVR
ncbi:MAG: HIRAN domain-containing protein [Planctomycetota bacterium]|nr:HIRAN domain-containing protein [Planctomycetota bacterium]